MNSANWPVGQGRWSNGVSINELSNVGKLVLATKQIDTAQSVMSKSIAPHTLLPKERWGAVDVAYYCTDTPPICLHRIRYGAPVTVKHPPTIDFFILQLTLSGHCSSTSQRGTALSSPNDLIMVNPDQKVTKEWEAGAEQLMIKIDKNELERHLAMETDNGRVTSLAFESIALHAEEAGAMVDLIRLIGDDLLKSHPVVSKPATSRYLLSSLLSLILHSMPHNGRQLLAGPISPAAPRYVRRAEDFIRQHIASDFGVQEIASSAGVSGRSITKGFRRFRETTPMNYVRSLRLDIARQKLLQADNARHSVTTIALSCGIHHLSRFAQDYAARFGELPSETIRRSRSQA